MNPLALLSAAWKIHVSALMHKLGACHRTEAVGAAIELGLVGP